jgi:hypothetical protein
MKKLFLILCLSVASINAMELKPFDKETAQKYFTDLLTINHQYYKSLECEYQTLESLEALQNSEKTIRDCYAEYSIDLTGSLRINQGEFKDVLEMLDEFINKAILATRKEIVAHHLNIHIVESRKEKK